MTDFFGNPHKNTLHLHNMHDSWCKSPFGVIHKRRAYDEEGVRVVQLPEKKGRSLWTTPLYINILIDFDSSLFPLGKSMENQHQSLFSWFLNYYFLLWTTTGVIDWSINIQDIFKVRASVMVFLRNDNRISSFDFL